MKLLIAHLRERLLHVTNMIVNVKKTAKVSEDLIGRHAHTLAVLKKQYALLAQSHLTTTKALRSHETLSMRKISNMEVWELVSLSSFLFPLSYFLLTLMSQEHHSIRASMSLLFFTEIVRSNAIIEGL